MAPDGLGSGAFDPEVETHRHAHGFEHPQRVIAERHLRVEGRAEPTPVEVARPVLQDLPRIDAAIDGDFSRRVEANFPDAELNAIASSINNLVATVDRGVSETGTVLAALADPLAERLCKLVCETILEEFKQRKAEPRPFVPGSRWLSGTRTSSRCSSAVIDALSEFAAR